MRGRIVWLVAATTSAVVMAFVIPLCLLVANLAEDRASARVRDQAQSVATLVATIGDPTSLEQTISSLAAEGPAVLLVTADDTVVGAPATLPPDTLTGVRDARADQAAFVLRQDHGVDAFVPVVIPGGTVVVVATASQAEVTAGVTRAWVIIGGLGVVLVAASVLLARDLGRRVTNPVTDVATVAHRLREGDHSARAQISGPSETVELGQALNALAERVDGLVAQERRHVADLGHRLRTPITALRLDTDLITDPDVAARVREHVDHLHRSIDQVVRDARRPVREVLATGCDLAVVVRDRVAFWAPLAEDQARPLAVSTPGPGADPVRVAISTEDVDEVVDILMDNVFAHTPEGTAIDVRVQIDGTAGRRAHLIVTDSGPGLSLPAQERGASTSGSTGLGLDIVRRICEQAGGSLTLQDAPGGGLSARIDLPEAP